MKTLTLIFLACIFSIAAHGQCNKFFEVKEGVVREMTSYDEKGKQTGREEITITQVNETSSGYDATMNVKMWDKKDEEVNEMEMDMSCENGIVKIDMQKFMNQEQMEAFKDMDMEIEGDFLETPNDLAVGQSLKDGHINIKINGPMPMNFKTTLENRKVIGKEKITTPAGTFDCFKISYDIVTKTIMTMEISVIEYVTEKHGAVKSETFKKNGKLMGYTLLTGIK